MTIYISEPEFAARIRKEIPWIGEGFRWVTGPGRSGAIAAVYLSHAMGLAHIPYGSRAPDGLPGIIIDTATLTGATLRKAAKRYPAGKPIALYDESKLGRHKFWYEADYKAPDAIEWVPVMGIPRDLPHYGLHDDKPPEYLGHYNCAGEWVPAKSIPNDVTITHIESDDDEN